MSHGWLLDPSIQIKAVDEGEATAKRIAKSRAKLHKLAIQLGMDVKEVGFLVEVGPILAEEFRVYFSIVQSVNDLLRPYGLTLEKLNDMGNRLRGVVKDLIIKESLPFNREAAKRLRNLGAINLNLVQDMKINDSLLAQLVVSLGEAKFEDIHQTDKENMVEILRDVNTKLQQAAEIRPHTKKAQSLANELTPLMEQLIGYFKVYEPMKMKLLTPEEAKTVSTVPYKTAPHVTEELKGEASIQIVAQEDDVDEGAVMQLANFIQQVTAKMNELADQTEWIFENFNPIHSDLVNTLSRAISFVEGVGAVETVEVAPELALTSSKKHESRN